MDTIFALASGKGRAGVAVIRVSGPLAFEAVQALADRLPVPRQAQLSKLQGTAGLIDTGLVLCFPGPGSFTGEDVAEFQVHGSPAVVATILAELGGRQGFRAAEAGEFTRRALENGRLDLTEVEALGDLIEAETEAQRRAAVAQMAGGLRSLAEGWRVKLIRAAALIEATIDFADEDVPVDVTPEVLSLIDSVLPELRHEVSGFGVSERLRDGFEVAIVGRPNAGKSTLLNALAGREAAITSTVAGTTRDVIEVRMDLDGLPVTVLDTAGLRDAGDEVERIGVARGVERARAADLRVFLLDETRAVPLLMPGTDDIVVQGKGDLAAVEGPSVSGVTGEGLSWLVSEIGQKLERRMTGAAQINRTRHLLAVTRAIGAMESARDEVCAGSDRAEHAAEALRQALRALDGLIGRVDVENLLDEIFASFCIGK
ncbi:tRNA uridine-5-carboxymethylaminomethyl(34) synthesis GTPase MnmE [Frigidibacter sp. ROC022]|uniref:tRNA uridine-5-carboxymethylaminomethyl(34) synthesis GTPase MnmE n=1 Tax=Frigidibacter sp. ROC022 TaxID=2971796 RepID=UPI00215AE2BF|nr:tRNA uridine-5-carboxymethylaminomethyl(34) synthesis GTPase MnmE [Frigidibacter sp. ROC022]MCR8724471.1 tRNA uridine-5-carboxymethylaminomethyl(34) synthesis GTPase MnmE [Frigidibacter sp. ROC022]